MSLAGDLDQLEAVLKGERAAIRRLDAQAVSQAAQDKERIVVAIAASPLEQRVQATARLHSLFGLLRENAVLLAHARDVIADALERAKKSSPPAQLSRRI